MEHSTAIMEDAAKAIEGVSTSSKVPEEGSSSKLGETAQSESGKPQNNYNRRERKADFQDSSMHHGSRGRGGRRGGHRDNKRRKKGDMGRGEYL